MTETHPVPADRIAAVRRFNRDHTRLVGALDEGLLSSPYSLPQVRVLYEIANTPGVSAADLTRTLGLDPGYLSRLLKGLEEKGLVRREAMADNAKRLVLKLTDDGATTFAGLDAASAREVEALLSHLPDAGQGQLVGAMETVAELIHGADGDDAAGEVGEPFRLRDPAPGDMGWIAHRHGVLYSQEHGWDWRFEALVAEIVGRFVRDFQPEWERCWVAERDGPDGPEVIGSVFLVRASEDVAKLRLLYVEPQARGMRLGQALVRACIAFARAKGYRSVTLWTNDVLVAARRIYEAEGFTLAEEEPHRSFGRDLVGQNWTLAL